MKTRSRNKERSSSRFWEDVGWNVGIHAVSLISIFGRILMIAFDVTSSKEKG